MKILCPTSGVLRSWSPFHFFFYPCNHVLSADKALPIVLVQFNDTWNEALLMVVVAALEMDKSCPTLVVFVLTNRANLGRVKFGDLVREPGLDHV